MLSVAMSCKDGFRAISISLSTDLAIETGNNVLQIDNQLFSVVKMQNSSRHGILTLRKCHLLQHQKTGKCYCTFRHLHSSRIAHCLLSDLVSHIALLYYLSVL